MTHQRELKKVKVDPQLGVDSPMVIWHVRGLDGLTSTGSEGSTTSGDVGPSTPQPDMYAAICDAVFHSPDLPGAMPNGVWLSGFVADVTTAFGFAAAHEDGFAYVVYQLGSHLVGPVKFK